MTSRGGTAARWVGARRPRADAGQATMDYIGTLAVVVLVIGAVVTAFTASSGLVGERAAQLICKVLTLGQGGCGGSTDGQDRQPTSPCVVGSRGDEISAGISVTFIDLGGNRGFVVEERSDGTFKVTQVQGGDVSATAGAGASTSFTIADNQVGTGASASVQGGVVFQGGREWVVGSQEEVDRLTSAENWSRLDQVLGGSNPVTGSVLPWVRDQLGIGEQFPDADSVYVAGGVTASGSAYAGYGSATASAEGSASRLLGYRHHNDSGENTYYFETTVDGSASAELAGVVDQLGAGVEGEVKVLTSVTVDPDGNIVKASRSALATGGSKGLTNALFGGDLTPLTSEDVGTGTQWDATLPVRDDADRDAVLALLASSGINPLGIGVDEDPFGTTLDPLAGDFMDAVRDRGDLTRHEVETDDTTWFEGSGEVAVGAKLGLSGGYSTSTMQASEHEYWDGTGFADRTNC
jgi:hypothetical protein